MPYTRCGASGSSTSGSGPACCFKWFLDLNITNPAFDASTFSKNWERLMQHEVAAAFFDAVLVEARKRNLLSDEHLTVDGTLLESWASMKSFRPKVQPNASEQHDAKLAGQLADTPSTAHEGRNPEVDFHREKRSNATHASTTDSDARLIRKGKGNEAKLCLMGHVLMENRQGLAVDVLVTHATGIAEREAAVWMLDRRPEPQRRGTVGADKAYDIHDFVAKCRPRGMTPHVAQNTNGRRSAVDGRTTRHPGYTISQCIRERVEEIFGWMKTVGGGRKLRYLGLERNKFWAELTAATYNLVCMARIEVVSRALADPATA